MARQEFTTSNANIRFAITSVENSYSVSGNTSNVTAYVDIWRTNTGYTTYGTGSITLTINGTAYSASITPSMTITSTSRRLISQTVTVGHNTDGSKTIAVSASFSMDTPLNGSGSLNHSLTTIPRASTPSLSPSSQALGSAITISTNRASASFTHTISYAFGNASGTIASGVGGSTSWALPASLANQIPKATSGTGTITCKTYSGSTLIGTKSVSFTATVPTSTAYQPKINNTTVSESTQGIFEKFGVYVQSQSTLSVSMAASGAYSSTIKAYEIKANGQTFATSSGTTNALTGSGTLSINYKATDTRNRSVSSSSTISVLAYSQPTATINVKRANSNGVEDDQGAYALCTVNATITALNNLNDKSFIIRYKPTNSTSWTEIDITPSGYSLINYTRLVDGINTDTGYDFEIVVTDYFSSSVGQSALSTAFTTFDVHSSGRGFAFGKVSEEQNVLEISDEWTTKTGNIVINDIPLDYIVEQGTSGIWTYRKWNSGYCELDFKYPSQSFSMTATGQIFYNSSIKNISYPFELTELITVSSGLVTTTSNAFTWINRATTVGFYEFIIGRGTSTTVVGQATAHITGRWK